MGNNLLIRRASPPDISRILKWWLGSFRTSRWAGVVPNNRYKPVYAETIRQLLARGSTLEVACLEEQPSLLAGFCCSEQTPRDRILHYVFVRPHLRQGGVARKLLDSAGLLRGIPFAYTFRTRDMQYLQAGSYHMPELARRRDAHKPAEGPDLELLDSVKN